MATKLLTVNDDLSTSGGNWLQAEAGNLSISNVYTNTWTNITTTGTAQAVTFSNAGNHRGAFVHLRVNSSAGTTWSCTLTLKLQNAAGTVTHSTDTLALSYTTLTNDAFVWIPCTSTAVITGAGNYRYLLTADANSKLDLMTPSSAWAWLSFLDTSTTKPTTGDIICLGLGYELEIDETISLAQIFQGGKLWVDGTLGSGVDLTLTANYPILLTHSSKIDFGSVASPIPTATPLRIYNTGTSNGNLSIGTPYWHTYYSTYGTKFYMGMYGEQSTDARVRIAQDAAAGQAVVVLERDMSAIWSNGDTVALYGKINTSFNNVTYTISSMSGTSVTLSANLDYPIQAVPDKADTLSAAIVNVSEGTNYGIQIYGSTSTPCNIHAGEMSGIYNQFEGVYMEGFVYNAGSVGLNQNGVPTSDLVNYNSYFEGILINLIPCSGAASRVFTLGQVNNFRMENFHVAMDVTPSYGITLIGGSNHTFSNVTIKNSYTDNVGCFYDSATTITIDDLIISNPGGGTIYHAYCSLNLAANDITMTNSSVVGTVARFQGSIINVTDCAFENGGVAGVAFSTVATGVVFTDCDISPNYPAVTTNSTWADSGNEIGFYNNPTLVQAVFRNCAFGNTGDPSMTNAVPGSYIKFQSYDETDNNNYTLFKYGDVIETGYGLTDTTVWTGSAFAAAAVGQFGSKIIFKSGSSAFRFYIYDGLDSKGKGKLVGNLQNKEVHVGVRLKINNAAFYAGTHTKPTLNVEYDGGTVVSEVATGTTDAQWLTVKFVPTTTTPYIHIYLTGATDATTTNRDVYLGKMYVSTPEGTSIDNTTFSYWSDGLMLPPDRTLPIPEDILGVSASSVTDTDSWGYSVKTGAARIKVIDGGEIPIY